MVRRDAVLGGESGYLVSGAVISVKALVGREPHAIGVVGNDVAYGAVKQSHIEGEMCRSL